MTIWRRCIRDAVARAPSAASGGDACRLFEETREWLEMADLWTMAKSEFKTQARSKQAGSVSMHLSPTLEVLPSARAKPVSANRQASQAGMADWE